MDLRVRLKICERCVCLWYRAQVETRVFCAASNERFKELPTPQSRKRRGRPRKMILPTVFAVQASAETIIPERLAAANSTSRSRTHGIQRPSVRPLLQRAQSGPNGRANAPGAARRSRLLHPCSRRCPRSGALQLLLVRGRSNWRPATSTPRQKVRSASNSQKRSQSEWSRPSRSPPTPSIAGTPKTCSEATSTPPPRWAARPACWKSP
jgi:hypothetical protein